MNGLVGTAAEKDQNIQSEPTRHIVAKIVAGMKLSFRTGFKSLPVIVMLLFILQSLITSVEGAENQKEKVTINLPQNLVLKEFIKIISMRTNTVFVYQEQILRGQMAITAPPNFKVSAKDAFFFFEKIPVRTTSYM